MAARKGQCARDAVMALAVTRADVAKIVRGGDGRCDQESCDDGGRGIDRLGPTEFRWGIVLAHCARAAGRARMPPAVRCALCPNLAAVGAGRGEFVEWTLRFRVACQCGREAWLLAVVVSGSSLPLSCFGALALRPSDKRAIVLAAGRGKGPMVRSSCRRLRRLAAGRVFCGGRPLSCSHTWRNPQFARLAGAPFPFPLPPFSSTEPMHLSVTTNSLLGGCTSRGRTGHGHLGFVCSRTAWLDCVWQAGRQAGSWPFACLRGLHGNGHDPTLFCVFVFLTLVGLRVSSVHAGPSARPWDGLPRWLAAPSKAGPACIPSFWGGVLGRGRSARCRPAQQARSANPICL